MCIYDGVSGNSSSSVEIIEYASEIFRELRQVYGVSDEYLFKSFAPVHNV
jgi:hypothetical protein